MISPGDLVYDRDNDRIGWVVRYTSTSTVTNEKIYLIEWANGNQSSYYDWAVKRFKTDFINKDKYDRLCQISHQKSVNWSVQRQEQLVGLPIANQSILM